MLKLFQRLTLCSLLLLLPPSCKNQEKHSGDTLRLNLADDPTSLDPRVVRTLRDLTLVKQLFEGLTRLDQTGAPKLALAENVEISDDLLTYTFSLRDSFWTNGDPVTAHDFFHAWTRVLDPAFATDYAYMLYPIKNAKLVKERKAALDSLGIQVKDEKTLSVTLEAPTPYFLELAAFPTYYPVNRRIDLQNPLWASPSSNSFVSNGPFQLKKWLPQTEICVTKSPSYWDCSHVNLKEIAFSMITDNHTECTLFEKKELDWLGQPVSFEISSAIFEKMKKEGKAGSYPIAGTFWFKFNTQKAPFDSVDIRRAFAYAINRQEIIQHILLGNQAVATGPLPPSMSLQSVAYFDDGNEKLAQQCLASGMEEKGWTLSTLPAITLQYAPSERNAKIVQLVQQQWKKSLGVEVHLESVERQLYRRKVRMGLFQVGTGDWIADFNDPLAFLELFKYPVDGETGNGMNDTGWFSSKFVTLLDQSLTEREKQKRNELLHEAEKILMENMPIAPVYHYSFDYIKDKSVQDVILSPLGIADFKEARLL